MSNNHLNYYFDAEADVFYFSKGTPKATDQSEEVSDGVIARIDPKTHEVRGFTVLNFSKRPKRQRPVELPFKAEFGLVKA